MVKFFGGTSMKDFYKSNKKSGSNRFSYLLHSFFNSVKVYCSNNVFILEFSNPFPEFSYCLFFVFSFNDSIACKVNIEFFYYSYILSSKLCGFPLHLLLYQNIIELQVLFFILPSSFCMKSIAAFCTLCHIF